MHNLVNQYINKITINNINDFGIKNNIILDKNELNFIYQFINTYKSNLIDDLSPFENELKANLSDENYEKIIDLYDFYKSKYLV